MLLERFTVSDLAHFSYAVGCPDSRRLAIIDPKRDIDTYTDFARRHDFEISHVLETHIHADYASGARELAELTGARLNLSRYDEGECYDVAFPHREIGHGQSIDLGTVKIEAVHTPGHTPEHLAFLLRGEGGDEPESMLSGDFLFVGSLGRPDLLGEESKQGLAQRLFASVRKRLPALPDRLKICPAHGAGSMCGAGMGQQPSSTLGAERATNPYLSPELSEEEFVDNILAQVPPFPPYYRLMKELNSAGAALLKGLPGLVPLDLECFGRRMEQGHAVLDVRDPHSYARGHIPSSFSVGIAGSFSVWASWVIPYDLPLLLVAESAAHAEQASRGLIRVGLDRVAGYLEGGFSAWQAAARPVRETPHIQPRDVHRRLRNGEISLLDVRGDAEWEAGHVEGAIHVMGGVLARHLDEVPSKPVAVMCAGGYRSMVAAGVLERAGRRDVLNVAGGIAAWAESGLPVTR